MKRKNTKFSLVILTLIFVGGLMFWGYTHFNEPDNAKNQFTSQQEAFPENNGEDEEKEAENRKKTAKDRYEYFFKLLRDPATNAIPKNLRARELRHAKQMPSLVELNRQLKAKNPSVQVAEGFNWRLAGPPAIGGRTRALGIDQRNPDIIIAGGVSGGIWRSNDGGDTWTLRTPDFDSFSVTSLAQDATNPDTWYYVAGENLGNSASARGAIYSGTGVFRSTDNGLTWSRIPGAEDNDPTTINSRYDLMSRIVVNPATGTVYAASNGVGILRSPNGNNYDDITLGGLGEHLYADVTTIDDGTPSGRVIAVLSSQSFGEPNNNPGVFVSNDDGQSWNKITPSDFPTQYFRSVVAIAPSDPDIAYVFSNTERSGPNEGLAAEDYTFFKINLATGVSQNRSDNLPDFGGPVGYTATQNGYDMDIIVKPDDPDFVTIGTINLYRSRDGFATAPSGNSNSEKDEYWIGGYAKANDVSTYPNQHPDQHIQIYDPTNPDKLWSGHDGGLSVTNNVEARDVSWIDKNEGYIVTQFYDASISPDEGDTRFLGGTQDNGSPFFRFDEQQQDIGLPSIDVGIGDGAVSFITTNFLYVESQNGVLLRRSQDSNGNLGNGFAFVHPQQAQNQLFVHPYVVDPNDEGIMYYPGGSRLFRNVQVDQIDNTSPSGATQGWNELNTAAVPGFIISALAVSTQPANILYYAGSDPTQNGAAPVVMRLDNANTSNQSPTDVSIPNAPPGAYVSNIAINPLNGNDVLVAMSNYEITGLYHTINGGNSWNAVEGNLTGSNLQGELAFGPSLRSATIVSAESGPIYLLGTSTGVYATQNLDGNNTQWGRESAFDNNGISDIGFSVVEDITSRFSDGDVAVGTHGRGMFVGRFLGTVNKPEKIPNITVTNLNNPDNLGVGQAGDRVVITANNFQFSPDISKNDIIFGEVSLVKNIVDISPNTITVIIPRGSVARDAEPEDDGNFDITVTVQTESSGDLTDTFEIEPPGQNELNQNYPNPFSGTATNIPINLQTASKVTLIIYDTSGRRVNQPVKDKSFQAGTYNIPVNFGGKASGVYIYRIIAEPTNGGDRFVDSKKMTYIR